MYSFCMSASNLLIKTLQKLADRDHCIFSLSDLIAVLPTSGETSTDDASRMAVILSRCVKAGTLRRVCRGIYYFPVHGYQTENILFHAAARLRADELNYQSLETVLSEAGLISQIPINFITLMSSGRSHIIDCGDYGKIEFVHTDQKSAVIKDELIYDPERRLWRASVKQALRDSKVTGRSRDLINMKEAYEFI